MAYEHYKECSWHVDQYPFECDCGVERTKRAEKEVERLRFAVDALIDDVRSRHPGEKLRCPHMQKLAALVSQPEHTPTQEK